MFFAIRVEDRIRAVHHLRLVENIVDEKLCRMRCRLDAAYAEAGRTGVPPERLRKAMLLRSICPGRRDNQLCERIETDLVLRWFLDMDTAEDMFDPRVFTNDWRGLVMAVAASEANDQADPAAALEMINHLRRRLRIRPNTAGGDNG